MDRTQTAQFLASIEEHRLYTAYRLIALCGLRRGEAAGLRWCDLDLDGKTAVISQQLQQYDGRLAVCPPKTLHSTRVIALDHTYPGPGCGRASLVLRRAALRFMIPAEPGRGRDHHGIRGQIQIQIKLTKPLIARDILILCALGVRGLSYDDAAEIGLSLWRFLAVAAGALCVGCLTGGVTAWVAHW